MSTIITAEQVRVLRERTGAGMMECKKALVEANGNIETAIEIMRKTGVAKAAKKADRAAAEGIIIVKSTNDHKMAVMLEVNCETDFVARDVNFVGFAQQAAECLLQKKPGDVDALMNLPYPNSSHTIEQARQELVAKLGENIKVRRIAMLQSTGVVANYKHGDRIGVLVSLDVDNFELGKDIAMHIAANNPQAIAPNQISQEIIEKEREIFSAQAAASGKPAAIIEKMITGRIDKFLNEVTLLGQPFVKDPNQTVTDLLKAQKAQVLAFVRFQVGEGIEKATTDFAKEVMAQVGGAR